MSATLTEPARGVRRDSWTRLLYLQLGAFAFFLYAFSPSINLLKDDLHLSAGVAGLHSTSYAVGVTLGGLAAPRYIRRAGGSRPALWWGLVGLSLAVGLFCAVPALAVTLPAAAVCGVFGCWLCIAVPAALARAHGPETGPAAITEANAVAAFVGIAAPLAVGGAAAAGIGWRAALLAVAPLSGLLYLALGRVREPERLAPDVEQVVFEADLAGCCVTVADAGGGVQTATRAPVPAPRTAEPAPRTAELTSRIADRALAEPPTPAENTLRALPRRFWMNQLAGVCAGAIEFCLTLWCATLLQDRAGLSAGVAATGVTAVVAGMAVGRTVGGRLALRVPIDRLIFASFAANLLGFVIFWLGSTAVPMFAGLAVAGLGVALQFPLISARGIALSGGQAELAGAVNMFGAGIAVGTAPFALGFLSDRVGIHSAYLLLPVFIVVAVAAIAVSGARGEAGR
ncbi:MFS transporter [Catenulispora subtropica]|uniref:Major facilitator superfamily MFS_1 n=1 Tax=Catenulispora subtropica TaxID=450798 RepID=A0ABP5DGK5_9ACTN